MNLKGKTTQECLEHIITNDYNITKKTVKDKVLFDIYVETTDYLNKNIYLRFDEGVCSLCAGLNTNWILLPKGIEMERNGEKYRFFGSEITLNRDTKQFETIIFAEKDGEIIYDDIKSFIGEVTVFNRSSSISSHILSLKRKYLIALPKEWREQPTKKYPMEFDRFTNEELIEYYSYLLVEGRTQSLRYVMQQLSEKSKWKAAVQAVSNFSKDKTFVVKDVHGRPTNVTFEVLNVRKHTIDSNPVLSLKIRYNDGVEKYLDRSISFQNHIIPQVFQNTLWK